MKDFLKRIGLLILLVSVLVVVKNIIEDKIENKHQPEDASTEINSDGPISDADSKGAGESEMNEPNTNEANIEEEYINENAEQALIKLETTYQTMIGFGAGYTWYSDWMLKQPAYKEEIADLLFADAKMTILRFKNEYQYRNVNITEKSREKQIYDLAQKRAEQYGEDVTVLMSSWSPPAELKSNNKTAGHGTLNRNQDGEYMYQEFGDWWTESIEKYTNAGVKIDYISIQNECDFTADWDGMELAPIETEEQAAYSKAYLSVYDSLQKKFGDNAPLMIGPETMSFVPATLKHYMNPILEKNPDSVAGIAHHLYVGGKSEEMPPLGSTNEPDSFNGNFMDNYAGFGDRFPIWQTEFFRGTPLQTAMLINNSLVYGNLNAYVFWGGVWSGNTATAANDIISVDHSGRYSYGSIYWVMRHFSEFIRPGYIRVQVNHPYNRGFKVSAFKNTEATKLAVVLINPTEEKIEVALPVEGAAIKSSTAYQTILTNDAYNEGEYYNNIGALEKGNSIILEAKSITTVDIELQAK